MISSGEKSMSITVDDFLTFASKIKLSLLVVGISSGVSIVKLGKG